MCVDPVIVISYCVCSMVQKIVCSIIKKIKARNLI